MPTLCCQARTPQAARPRAHAPLAAPRGAHTRPAHAHAHTHAHTHPSERPEPERSSAKTVMLSGSSTRTASYASTRHPLLPCRNMTQGSAWAVAGGEAQGAEGRSNARQRERVYRVSISACAREGEGRAGAGSGGACDAREARTRTAWRAPCVARGGGAARKAARQRAVSKQGRETDAHTRGLRRAPAVAHLLRPHFRRVVTTLQRVPLRVAQLRAVWPRVSARHATRAKRASGSPRARTCKSVRRKVRCAMRSAGPGSARCGSYCARGGRMIRLHSASSTIARVHARSRDAVSVAPHAKCAPARRAARPCVRARPTGASACVVLSSSRCGLRRAPACGTARGRGAGAAHTGGRHAR
jgi:hypothetical protein